MNPASTNSRPASSARAAPALLALLALAGCGGSDSGGGGDSPAALRGTAKRGGAPPLIVVGADGLEWNLLLRWMGEGQLPNLAKLAHEGIAGEIATLDPNDSPLEQTLSPIVWTTIATGKKPQKHGITGFWYDGQDGEKHLFTSMHRQSKALWNLFDDAGLASEVIGWWCTFPAERIDGGMIAQTSTRAQIDISTGERIWKGTWLPGLDLQAWPEERGRAMDRHAQALADAIEAGKSDPKRDPLIAQFGPAPKPGASKLVGQLWGALKAGFYADLLFRDAAFDAVDAMKEPGGGRDALLVYFGITDVASHMYWRYLEPDGFDHRPSPRDVDDWCHVIRDAYRFVDAAVGELMRRAPGADFVLLSDHGFHKANVKFDFDGPEPDGGEKGRADSGHHLDAPPGVFLAFGPSFRRQPLAKEATRDDVKQLGRVEDVLPTLLVRTGLPYALDMDGRPMKNVLAPELLAARPIASVKSFEDAAWKRERAELQRSIPEFERKFEVLLKRMEEENSSLLRALGYGSGGEEPAPSPKRGAPPSDPKK